jgi:cytochrome c-type biogenesis protein CcmF
LAVAVAATIAVVALTDALDHLLALALFAFAFFALAALAAEFWRGAAAERALSGDGRLRSLARVTGRNRRRYGGYIVHAGVALLFMAVAASSSFQTSSDVRLEPGESAEVGDYTITYLQPTTAIDDTEQRLTFGSLIRVDENGEEVAVLHPSRNYYRTTSAEPSVRGFFEGEATSEVGRRTEITGDVWTAMRPDLTRFDEFIDTSDRRIIKATGGEDIEGAPFLEETRANLQGLAVNSIAKQYAEEPTEVDFRINVNPFVIWIWVGGAIGIAGALIAVWPAPEARRRRVSDVYAARLARDLARSGQSS